METTPECSGVSRDPEIVRPAASGPEGHVSVNITLRQQMVSDAGNSGRNTRFIYSNCGEYLSLKLGAIEFVLRTLIASVGKTGSCFGSYFSRRRPNTA